MSTIQLPNEFLATSIKKQWTVSSVSTSIKWRPIGKLHSLFIHPIKSTRGIAVDHAEVWRSGLRRDLLVDRRMKVVKADDGRVMTGIRLPKLVLIESSIEHMSNHQLTLTLKAPHMDDIEVELPHHQGTESMDAGDAVSDWLTAFLCSDSFQHRLRLLVHPDHHGFAKGINEVDDDQEDFFNTKRATLLLTSQTSLECVQQRLERDFKEDAEQGLKIDIRRFRPNIVVTDVSEAFEEDDWPLVRIGDKVVLQSTELCDRCILTTVDPDNGEKHVGGQPLKVLRTFRATKDAEEKKKYGTKPFFGIYFKVLETGNIRVGDQIYVGQ